MASVPLHSTRDGARSYECLNPASSGKTLRWKPKPRPAVAARAGHPPAIETPRYFGAEGRRARSRGCVLVGALESKCDIFPSDVEPAGNIGDTIYLLLLIIVGGGHGGRHPWRRNRYRFSSSSTCLMYGRGNASGRRYPAGRSGSFCPYVHVRSVSLQIIQNVLLSGSRQIKLAESFFLYFRFATDSPPAERERARPRDRRPRGRV